ncbi:hypothetical protein M1446_03610 [Candidatus Dependentiae bacterium]|nr:hypothetical protein [Candidatus Dependentiae bacterium]
MFKLKTFFLTTLFLMVSPALAEQSRTEILKNKANRNFKFIKDKSKKIFDASKVKSKQTLKWVKDHKKYFWIPIGITAFIGFAACQYHEEDVWPSLVHSPVTGLNLYMISFQKMFQTADKYCGSKISENYTNEFFERILLKLGEVHDFLDNIAELED